MTLTIRNISKKYRQQIALHNISCDIKPETIYGLLGRNGAGKSTLLNIIAHRINANAGEVCIDGDNVWTMQFARQQLFLTSEDTWFDPNMKVHKIMSAYYDFYDEFDMDFCHDLLRVFEVNTRKRFQSLSTGYRSIVKLIIALCMPMPYIFLDEPVLGLDANHRLLFNKKLLEAYERRPRSFVISTHMIEEIAYLLEEVIIVDKGEVLQQSSLETLLQSGHVVSGQANLVDEFIQNLNILNTEYLGTLKQVSVVGDLPDVIPPGISVTPLTLQTYFVHLTNNREV